MAGTTFSFLNQHSSCEERSGELGFELGWFIAMIIVIVPMIPVFMLHDTDINGFIAMILMMYVNWLTCDPGIHGFSAVMLMHDTLIDDLVAMILMLYDVHATNDFIVMIQSTELFYAMVQEHQQLQL